MWLTRACVNTASACSLSAPPPSKSNPVVWSSFRAIAGGGAGCGVIVASSLKKKKTTKTIGDSRAEAGGVSSAGRVWWGIRHVCSVSDLGSLPPTHGSGRGGGDRAGAVDVLELLDLCNAADRWTSSVCKWVPGRSKLFCCILKI